MSIFERLIKNPNPMMRYCDREGMNGGRETVNRTQTQARRNAKKDEPIGQGEARGECVCGLKVYVSVNGCRTEIVGGDQTCQFSSDTVRK